MDMTERKNARRNVPNGRKFGKKTEPEKVGRVMA